MKIKQDKRYNIGANIRKYRMECNLTQEETVTKMQLLGLNITRSIYSQIECGIYNIRAQELLALCEIFHIKIDALFEGMHI